MKEATKLWLMMGLLYALSLLAASRLLFDTFTLALHNDAYTHILLILPVSAVLIFRERKTLRPMVAPGIRAGSPFLVVGLLIFCVALVWPASISPTMRLTVRMFALVLGWIGIFMLFLGSQVAKTVSFSLLLLFGLVPLPPVMVNGIVAFLQQGSVWSARALFELFGVPVVQDGIQLTIPGLITLQVADECSSIRSSSMLLVTTIIVAQIFLCSPWRKLLVIGFAVPLSIAKNGLRIFTIAMLGSKVDRGYLTGRFHHQGGILFFAVALAVIVALLWIMRRGEDSLARSARSVA